MATETRTSRPRENGVPGTTPSRLGRHLRSWLPATVASDGDDARRALTIVGMAHLLLVSAPAEALSDWLVLPPPYHAVRTAILAATSAIAVAALFAVRRRGALDLAGRATLTAIALSLASRVLFTGGIYAAHYSWIGLLPLLGALLCGEVYRWLVVAVCLLVGLAMPDLLGWPLPAAIGTDRLPSYVLSVQVTLAGCVACLAALIDWTRVAQTDALAAARRQAEDEAEIAATLGRIGHVLHEHLRAPDMLERAGRLAVDVLGLDWIATYLWHDGPRVFRLATLVGGTIDDASSAWTRIEFSGDALPLFSQYRRGAVVELADADGQTFVPPELLRRFHITSAMYAPIFRDETVVGVLVFGHSQRRGPFSPRERRLARGFADATALALENARLLAELRGANEVKSELVGTMSHELRTPIHIISGYLEQLADSETGDLSAGQLDTVRRVQRTTRELLDLVNATLDLRRLEAGRETIRRASTDVGDLLEVVVRESEALAAPGVALRREIEESPLLVLSDSTKIKTILKNLVGNALKFTSAGEVVVSARCQDGHLALVVRDTGIGIDARDVQVIFEMFRQVPGAANHRAGGVGLGLHIVKQLVDLLGGDIRVESTPGLGSTFTVTLPVERAGTEQAGGRGAA